MSDNELRAFMDLLMCSDPWPTGDPEQHDILSKLANHEAGKRGYPDWIAAYHEFKVSEPKEAQ